ACQSAAAPLHGAAAPGSVLPALPDDPAGQLHRVPTEIGPQLGDDLGLLGVELSLALADDPLGLGLRLGPHLLEDLLPLGASVVPDPGRLGESLGQLRLVLLQRPLRDRKASWRE